MIAKNGIDYEAMGFVVYGKCPEYKGYFRRKNMSKGKNVSFTSSYKLWSSLKNYAKLCEEWKEYSNFEKWYDENYYELSGERMELSYRFIDLYNEIYSPNMCCFLPKTLNLTLNRLGSSSSEEGISDFWKTVLPKQYINIAEKYEKELPESIFEKLINFETKVTK